MLIAKAYAATAETVSETAAPVPGAPSATESFMWNMGMILVLVALFYVLMILPQQRRFKEHSAMLAGLKKGDKIVTGGGLVGTIDKIIDDYEASVDLGNDMKVTVLRSSLQKRSEKTLSAKRANDQKDKQKNKG